jgi:hypothetical protein
MTARVSVSSDQRKHSAANRLISWGVTVMRCSFVACGREHYRSLCHQRLRVRALLVMASWCAGEPGMSMLG